MINFDKYNNIKASALRHIPEKSQYNRNFYEGFDNEILYAVSDDDNATDWYFCSGDSRILFAESFCSEDDVIHVFDKEIRASLN